MCSSWPTMCVFLCILSKEPCFLTCFNFACLYGSVFISVLVCISVCSVVAQPASLQALGLLTAPVLPVNLKNSSMCEWRAAEGTMPREQKQVWGVYVYLCAPVWVSTCLYVYGTCQRGCHSGNPSWKSPPVSLPSFHKPNNCRRLKYALKSRNLRLCCINTESSSITPNHFPLWHSCLFFYFIFFLHQLPSITNFSFYFPLPPSCFILGWTCTHSDTWTELLRFAGANQSNVSELLLDLENKQNWNPEMCGERDRLRKEQMMERKHAMSYCFTKTTLHANCQITLSHNFITALTSLLKLSSINQTDQRVLSHGSLVMMFALLGLF